MDIKRPPKSKIKKKIRNAIMIVVGIAAIGGITYGLTKLKPAAPTLDRSTAVIETVKRGEMVRDVRGNGTLVPEVTRWVPAPADGRIEKILLKAGVEVDPSTVIAELSNPQLEQQATDTELQVKAAEADQENLKVKLESESMTQKAAIATINSQYSQAKLQLDADEVLAKQGLVADLTLKISRVNVQDLANRLKVEQERLIVSSKSTKAQMNAAASRLNQLRALATLRRQEVDALKVRAGSGGVSSCPQQENRFRARCPSRHRTTVTGGRLRKAAHVRGICQKDPGQVGDHPTTPSGLHHDPGRRRRPGPIRHRLQASGLSRHGHRALGARA